MERPWPRRGNASKIFAKVALGILPALLFAGGAAFAGGLLAAERARVEAPWAERAMAAKAEPWTAGLAWPTEDGWASWEGAGDMLIETL